MKSITDKKDRRLLLQKLRTTVRLQILLWDQCNEIGDILYDGGDDAVLLVDRFGGNEIGEILTGEKVNDPVFLADPIGRRHAGTKLQLSDVDAIKAGFMEINKINSLAELKNLNEKIQYKLLACLQNALHLQSKLVRDVTSLAKALGYTRKQAMLAIIGWAMAVETEMELGDRELQSLLRAPKAKD